MIRTSIARLADTAPVPHLTQFRKGQRVKVSQFHNDGTVYERMAEIAVAPSYPETKEFYTVRFSNGSHAFIEASYLKAVSS
jgi:hypothetical protein